MGCNETWVSKTVSVYVGACLKVLMMRILLFLFKWLRWTEAGEFLISWVEAGGIDQIEDMQDLLHMERLLQTDDMFLMGLVVGTQPIPDELNNTALIALQEFSEKLK